MSSQQDRFARPFADIWQHIPFRSSARVAEFLARFTESERFDAERFWEFVTTESPAAKASVLKRSSPTM